MAMYSFPEASHPTVSSSMKFGILTGACAADAGRSITVRRRPAIVQDFIAGPMAGVFVCRVVSEGGLRCRRDRLHVEIEETRSALGTARFRHRSLSHPAPGLDEFQGLLERRRVLDDD